MHRITEVDRDEIPTVKQVVVPVDNHVVTHSRVREHATGGQRFGILVALIEAVGLGIIAVMHFGYGMTIEGTRYEVPLSFAAGIVDGLLALAVLLAIVVPGGGGVRAGRVLAVQLLVVLGVFVNQAVLVPGVTSAVYEGAVLVLALASLALIAAPAYRRTVEHHS